MLLVYHNNLRRGARVVRVVPTAGVNRDTGQGLAGHSPAMVYVKGYDNTPANAVIRTAQVRARNALLLEFAATIVAIGVLE